MSDVEFSQEELCAQAAGNQSAIFLTVLDWALERDGSVDGRADFIGKSFASSWEEPIGMRLDCISSSRVPDVDPAREQERNNGGGGEVGGAVAREARCGCQ